MTYQGVAPIFFHDVTDVSSTPKVDVGTQRVEGLNHYIYVYNDGGADITTGLGAVLQSGATGASVTVSSVTSADFLMGVAVNTLTTGTYGYLLARGIGTVQMKAGASATVAAGGLIEVAANGFFAPVSNTTGNAAPACGKALAAITSGTSGSAFISVY